MFLKNTGKSPQHFKLHHLPSIQLLTGKSPLLIFSPICTTSSPFSSYIYICTRKTTTIRDALNPTTNSSAKTAESVRDLTRSAPDWSLDLKISLCVQNSVLNSDRRHAGGRFRRVLLEPPRRCPHQPPLPRRRRVSSSPSLPLSLWLCVYHIYMYL